MSDVEDFEAFSDVIDKFRIIADNEYEGEIYDNVLSIYMQLTHSERKLFLKSLLQVYFIFSRSIQEPTTEIDQIRANKPKTEAKDKKPKEPCAAIQGEIEDIDDANEYELIKLKTWLVKWFVSVGSISVIAFIAFMMYTNQTGEANVWKDNVMAVWNVVKVLFNI